MHDRYPLIIVAIISTLSYCAPSDAAERDITGYPLLQARLGALQADGAGVSVAQVEVFADGTSNYAPDTSGPAYSGKTFTLRSGATGISPHAGQVANVFYSNTNSIAPRVSDVSLFSADSFITGLLRVGRANRAPGGAGAMVVNNSWIAAYPADPPNIETIRRLDDLIDRDDLPVFNAVSNTPGDPFPKLLASSYNGISIGTLTGSRGPFTFDGGARSKPDLVLDEGATSNATGLASGAGALLRSEAIARRLPAGELAIKAILMAGAHRDANWHRGRMSGKDNTAAPLDFQQGAGQLRVDHSFDILTAGRQSAGTSIDADAGWDFARTARDGSEADYYLHVGQTQPHWAAMLTWNRTIRGLRKGSYSIKTTLPDFALALYLSKRGGRRLIAISDSPSDNVESLTLDDLGPGDYQLVVTSDVRSYYSLAWFDDAAAAPAGAVALAALGGSPLDPSGLTFAAMPEPGALAFLACPAGWMLFARPRRQAR